MRIRQRLPAATGLVNDDGGSAALIIIPIILAAITVIVAELILAVGAASTAISWIPRPRMGLIRGAFAVVGVVAIALAIMALVVLVGALAEPALLIGGIIGAVFLVPAIFLVHHAATTVWAVLPETYAAQTNFLFLLSSVILGLVSGGSGSSDD